MIVDIGCGDGVATAVAAQLNPGHQFVGVDWSADALRQARARGLALIRAGVEGSGLPLASASADVVIMSEVIEHLVDTDSALDEAFRVLKPGGSLLLSTPNLAAWYNRGLLAFGVQPVFSEVSLRGVFGRPGSQVAGHLHMFTRRALTGLLAARGFDSIKVEGARYHDVPRPLRPVDLAFARGRVQPRSCWCTPAKHDGGQRRRHDRIRPAAGRGAAGLAGRLVREHGPAAAVGLALGLLALGPGLARGFLLSYDMVFVPYPPFSSALLGLGGGPARAVPSDAVITVAAGSFPPTSCRSSSCC